MLQQILSDMFIDPELLAELSDEQKQILFCRMREEQIKRFNEHERIFAEKERNGQLEKSKKKTKNIEFRTGQDGNEWVWVMGEHPSDRPIEQILEEEAQEKARMEAEIEAEEMRKREEEEIKRRLQEEQKRLESEKRRIEELRRKEEEQARMSRMAQVKADEERRKKEAEEVEKRKVLQETEVRLRQDGERRRQDMIKRRSGEIYTQFQEVRKRFEKMAANDGTQLEAVWRENEDKWKRAEQERRENARMAREEHRRSLLVGVDVIQAVQGFVQAGVSAAERRNESEAKSPQRPPPIATQQSKTPPPIPLRSPQRTSFVPSVVRSPIPADRPSRPPNREAVVDWFVKQERPRGAGVDPVTGTIPKWFHGIITRQQAEALLENKPVGSFLVRVSERIWGYAVSYRARGHCKHFLIEVLPNGRYRFFGTTILQPYNSLAGMVKHYSENPVSAIGQEHLLHPQGQDGYPPDYSELFNSVNEDTYNTQL